MSGLIWNWVYLHAKKRFQVFIFLILEELWQNCSMNQVSFVLWLSLQDMAPCKWRPGRTFNSISPAEMRPRISVEFNLFNIEFETAEMWCIYRARDGFNLQHFKACSGALFILFLEVKSKITNVLNVPHAINGVRFNIKTQICKYIILKVVVTDLKILK